MRRGKVQIAAGMLCLLGAAPISGDPATADPRPLADELLPNPVGLKCGAVIREVRGGELDVKKLNEICSHVAANFHRYTKAQELREDHRERFEWSFSFLPEGDCPRCLNDTSSRFKGHSIRFKVLGLTDLHHQYTFMISDESDKHFQHTFVHELFHAMSMYYGVYRNHIGNYRQKTRIDEEHAVRFTAWLRY